MSDERPWRRWYGLKRWKSLRTAQLRRSPWCAFHERRDQLALATVVDHVKPHRGDETLFWDADNLQSLCKPCHDAIKQASESKGLFAYSQAVDRDGYPIDPAHWANRSDRR